MAFNRFMHPRNVYKTSPPNFSELAEKYPEFRQHCTIECSGKVNVNFKEPDAVRALTRVLLMENFGLDVELPEDSLVPRIPQRLNYILWIEDMLLDNKNFLKVESPADARGIDIGTGASCVYPLLGARHCGLNFIATDKDPEAVACARRNVEKNQLQNKIKILQVSEKCALFGALVEDSNEETFHFCMCNPPFYDSSEVTDDESGSLRCCSFTDNSEKSPAKKCRASPHSVTVAKQSEVCSEGGEYGFISRIIEDSVKLKSQISIYTSMIGKKANVAPLKAKLRSVGVTAMSETIFCQGKTQRWALAWTFDANVILKKLDPAKSKKGPSFSFHFSMGTSNKDLEAASLKFLNALDKIKICYNRIDGPMDSCLFQCEAHQGNTWSNQRRKRRTKMLEERKATKELRLETSADATEAKNCPEDRVLETSITSKDDGISSCATNGLNGAGTSPVDDDSKFCCRCRKSSDSQSCLEEKDVLLRFVARIQYNGDEKVLVTLDWLSGQNKDHLHQLLQYLKNCLVLHSDKAD